MQCTRCPRGCTRGPGLCGVVAVEEEGPRDLHPWRVVYVSILRSDDVPLYHVAPGLSALRIVVPGSGFRCSSCWWDPVVLDVENITLRELDEPTLRSRSRMLSPSALLVDGGEPLLQDYVMDVPSRLRDLAPFLGVKTTGYVAEDRLREASKHFDFVVYEYVLGVERLDERECKIITSNLSCAVERFKCVELHVLCDGSRRSIAALREVAEEYGAKAAVHAVPTSSTDESSLSRLYKVVKELREEGLHVYLYGDTSFTLTDTRCPSCGAPIVERKAWGTRVVGTKVGTDSVECSRCGYVVRGLLVPSTARKPLALHRELVVF